MRSTVTISIGALLLLMPALLNGLPFFFFDTGEYARLGRALFAGFRDFDDSKLWLTFLGGRAVSYSMLLTALVKAGGFWLVAIFQSLIGAFLIYLVCFNTLGNITIKQYFALMTFLGFATTAGLYASYMMPDIFAAYGLIAIYILYFGNGLTNKIRGMVWTLLIFCGTCHTTNILLFLFGPFLGVSYSLLIARTPIDKLIREKTIIFLAPCISLGLVLTAAWFIRLEAGEPLRSPPYLMARVLADGPGRDWLNRKCETSTYEICNYRNLPLDNHNAILWNPSNSIGVYVPATYDERIKISDEERDFVKDVLIEYPLNMFSAAVSNGFKQFATIDPKDEMANARVAWDEVLRPSFPSEHEKVIRSLNYNDKWNWSITDLINSGVLILSVIFIGLRTAGCDFRYALFDNERSDSEYVTYRRVAIILFGVIGAVLVMNALICGALSGPSARYQARIVWLLPAFAFLHALMFDIRGAWRPVQDRLT